METRVGGVRPGPQVLRSLVVAVCAVYAGSAFRSVVVVRGQLHPCSEGEAVNVAKPLQFFLPTDASARYFYVVELYDTQKEMCDAVREINPGACRPGEELECACLRYVVASRDKRFRRLQKKHDQIGTLYFFRSKAYGGSVVHELTHAAVGWAKRARVDPLKQSNNYDKCPEERFARTMQFLYEEFFERLYKVRMENNV